MVESRISKTAPSAIRAAAIVSTACALAVAVTIFVLSELAPDVTSAQSGFVEQLLFEWFGDVPGVYDARTGLWLGVTVRHWAHVVEYWALGLFAAVAAVLAALLRARVRGDALKARTLAVAGALAVAACAAFSLFDQVHKVFVPGRHFDVADLAFDALGYGTATIAVLAVTATVLALGHARLRMA